MTVPNIPVKDIDTVIYINRPMNISAFADENVPSPALYPVRDLECDVEAGHSYLSASMSEWRTTRPPESFGLTKMSRR